MMDHTLIVYTSNNADKQHTNGANWPVMLLGNCRRHRSRPVASRNWMASDPSTRSTRRSCAPQAGQYVRSLQHERLSWPRSLMPVTGPLKEVLVCIDSFQGDRASRFRGSALTFALSVSLITSGETLHAGQDRSTKTSAGFAKSFLARSLSGLS